MTRRLELMPTPQGLGSAQTATINLPIGPTYDTILINPTYSANGNGFTPAIMATFLKDIRLIVNGDTRIEIAAKDLIKINDYYGVPATDGVLALHLAQPWTRTISGEDSTSYGTRVGVASLSLEIDLSANWNGGHSLSVSAVQSAPKPFGAHLRVQRFSEDMALVGEKEIANIPTGAYSMMAMHITTDKIDDLEVLANNRKIHRSKKMVRNGFLQMAKRFPQIDMTHIDFMPEDRMSNSLPMALQDFRAKLDVTEQDQTFKIYAFSIQGLTPV